MDLRHFWLKKKFYNLYDKLCTFVGKILKGFIKSSNMIYNLLMFMLCCGMVELASTSSKHIPKKKVVLKVGVLTPAGKQAEEMIYEKYVSYGKYTDSPIYELKVTSKKTTCRGIELSEETSKLIHLDKVGIIFGPHCSGTSCRRVLESANYSQKPIITYKCDDTYFEGISRFLSVLPETKKHPREVVHVFGAIMDSYNWKYAAIIYSKENEVEHNQTVESLRSRKNLIINSFKIESYGTSYNNLMSDVKKKARG